MKRSLSLILLAAVCALALAAVTSLSGCAAQDPANDPTGTTDPPEPVPVITGEAATYTSGYVDMALTIPEGWQWEAVQRQGTTTEGIRFWKTDNRALNFELLCWRNGYGICGTGVTSEELTLSGGQKVWQHTEESDEGLWLNLYFENVPGDYVCQFSDSLLDKAVWEAGRNEVLAILGTAQFGRTAMTEQEAIDLAAAQYGGQYDAALTYGRYSVIDGCWTVTFSKGAMGENSDSFLVSPDGTVDVAMSCYGDEAPEE